MTLAARLCRLEFLRSQGRSTTRVPCSLRFLMGCLSVVQILAWIFFAPVAFADAAELAAFGGQWARVVDVAEDQARIASGSSGAGVRRGGHWVAALHAIERGERHARDYYAALCSNSASGGVAEFRGLRDRLREIGSSEREEYDEFTHEFE